MLVTSTHIIHVYKSLENFTSFLEDFARKIIMHIVIALHGMIDRINWLVRMFFQN